MHNNQWKHNTIARGSNKNIKKDLKLNWNVIVKMKKSAKNSKTEENEKV